MYKLNVFIKLLFNLYKINEINKTVKRPHFSTVSSFIGQKTVSTADKHARGKIVITLAHIR